MSVTFFRNTNFYFPFQDDTIAADVVVTFERYEDMVTCKNLFALVFKHMADKETMCIAILSIVKAAVSRLLNDDAYRKLVNHSIK